ncbi:MAG: GNAT family N-acetyltransferase [Methylacidiphilales bacterium]|nr:GNAT family N-acetyltransferase [Candidatus Methylacidiphilales bacterium]
MNHDLRVAIPKDKTAIECLIEKSARDLSREYYTDSQIEAAIAFVFGIDSELIADKTYFVVEADGELVGCGGWSQRKTLFGSDRYSNRESGLLNPKTDAAKIRAFFVHPQWARQGIGRILLNKCIQEAQLQGFQWLELMATLPGVKLYKAMGFEEKEKVKYQVAGIDIDFVPMSKSLV